MNRQKIILLFKPHVSVRWPDVSQVVFKCSSFFKCVAKLQQALLFPQPQLIHFANITATFPHQFPLGLFCTECPFGFKVVKTSLAVIPN